MARTAGNPTHEEFSWLLAQARTPRLRTLTEFAAAEIVVPKGHYRGARLQFDTQPFFRIALEAIDSGRWPRVAIVGSVQSGKSLLGHGLPALYHLFEHREATILGAPTMKVCRDKYLTEVLPLITASRYRRLLPADGSGSRGGFAEEIVFGNGARLKFMSGGGGDENRSSYTARVAMVTEADKMDTASETSRETDPIDQIEARSDSYPETERRLYVECTVSIPEGRIWTEYTRGTQSRIACPCPHCSEYVTPEREHLLGWQQADSAMAARRAAYFACPACGEPLSAAQRREMNVAGRLVHRGQSIDRRGRVTGEPPDTLTLGLRWNAFNNLFWEPGEIGAREWTARNCPGDEEANEKYLCQFVWVVPWQSPEFDAAPLDPHAIRRRHTEQRYTRGLVPSDAEHLTVGVDLGKRVGHWMAIAWRPVARGLVVEYSTFEVPSEGMDVAKAIVVALEDLRDEVLLRGWRTPEGELRTPSVVLVDVGYMPDSVFAFTRQAACGKRFLPALGRGLSQHDRRYRTYQHPTKTGAEVKRIGLQYYISWVPAERAFRADVNADHWKSWLHDRLRTPVGEPGAVEFYAATDRNEHLKVAQHFAAEEPREIFVEGRGAMIMWEKRKRGNHYLDAAYNACAAGHLVGVRLIDTPRPTEPPLSGTGEPAPAVTTPDGRPFLLTERG